MLGFSPGRLRAEQGRNSEHFAKGLLGPDLCPGSVIQDDEDTARSHR